MSCRRSLVPLIIAALTISGAISAEAPMSEAVTMTTSDGVSISGSLFRTPLEGETVPAIVFIHQGGSRKEEWLDTALLQNIISAGWIALLIDLRGHGESGGGPVDFARFFDDPQQAPNDLAASIAFLQSLDAVDTHRIAIVGASVGGNLATMAAGDARFEIATAIAISAKTSAVYNLAGGEDRMSNLTGVFYVASANDQDGLRADWARELFARTAQPKDLVVVASSDAHGVSIFNDDPNLEKRLFEWLSERLADSGH